MEFEMSPDEKIEHYYDEVCIVLTEMDFDPNEVLVTDESELWDFFPDEDDPDWLSFQSNMFKRYGLRVSKKDRIWKLAERVKYGK